MSLLLETFALQTQDCFICIHLSTHKIRLRDGILILITHQKKGDKAYDQNFNWTLLIRLFFL